MNRRIGRVTKSEAKGANSEGLDLEIFVIHIWQVFKLFKETRSLRIRATCTKIRDFFNIVVKEGALSLE